MPIRCYEPKPNNSPRPGAIQAAPKPPRQICRGHARNPIVPRLSGSGDMGLTACERAQQLPAEDEGPEGKVSGCVKTPCGTRPTPRAATDGTPRPPAPLPRLMFRRERGITPGEYSKSIEYVLIVSMKVWYNVWRKLEENYGTGKLSY